MNKDITLKNLKIGETALIKEIFIEGDLKKRLYELGFIKGSVVKCILKSPLNDPKAYFIKGTTIALRNDITKNIICEKEE